MAPVPAIFDPSLTVRLTELTEAQTQTRALIAQLSRTLPASNQSSPSESSINLPQNTNGDAADLSAEIHESLRDQEEALDLVRQELEELPPASASHPDRRKAEAAVSRIEEDIKLSRTQFRKAQLQAKRNAQLAKIKERDALFAGRGSREGSPMPGRKRKEGLTQDELVAHASSDVLTSLRRTHDLMDANLKQSQFANDALQEQTAALASLQTKYTDLDDLLVKSKGLVRLLIRSNKSDTWYLQTTMYVLGALLVWIVYRRFLYGPLWWFVYLPLKLVWWTLASLLALMGVPGRASPPPLVSVMAPTVGQGQAAMAHPTWAAAHTPVVVVGAGGRGAPMYGDMKPSQPPNGKKRDWQEPGVASDDRDEL